MLEPSTSSEKTTVVVIPLFLIIQELPPLVERKAPPSVPANASVPLSASAWIYVFVMPVLELFQVAPLSVDRNKPVAVAAYNVLPLIAMSAIEGCVIPPSLLNPLLMALH